MKRLHTGVIIFDAIDIICISFSAGSSMAYLIRKYKNYKKNVKINGVDPIVTELKEKSSVTMVSVDGQPLKLQLIRGGAESPKGFSLLIKNKKIATLIRMIVYSKTKQRQLRLLRIFFATLNAVLTSSTGIGIAVGGSLDYTQFLLFALPSTLGGFLIGQAIANPLAAAFLPIAFLYSRGIEDIADPYEKCQAICKVAEDFYNNQLLIEMEILNSALKDASAGLQLPLDRAPLLCVEEKLSLLQRYKLKQLIRSEKARNRVQHFNKFLKKFPECNPDPKSIYEQIVEKTAN